MPVTRATVIQDFFSVIKVPESQSYLGVPFEFHRSKIKTFRFLKAKLQHRLQSWKAKLLTPAGRDVLVKSTLVAIPTYTFSDFLLPSTLIEELEKIVS